MPVLPLPQQTIGCPCSKLPVRSYCLSRGSRVETKSINPFVKRPKLYLADTGLLCELLNIRFEEALRQSPAVGAVWETFVFAQLRDREHCGGRTGSLFFWRDRTREVVICSGYGRAPGTV